MNDKIPTITPETIAGTIDNNASSKSVDEITSETRNQYVAGGSENATTPLADGRKKRSDAGRARGPRKNLGENAGKGKDLGEQKPSVTLDKVVVEKTVKSVVGAIDGVLVRKIGKTAFMLSKDLDFAKELAGEAGVTPSELDLMGELTAIIFEKYGLLSGYAPEILLGITVTAWGTRVTLVMRKLNQMVVDLKAEQKKKEKQETDVSTPPTR